MKGLLKKVGAFLIAAALLVVLLPLNGAKAATPSDDITIFYTNDVHTYVDKSISYDTIAALKKEYADAGKAVLLVDAGDHIQGTAYGAMDKGATIVALMEAAGYDLATMGNHEFDYDMPRALEIITGGKIPYVSCNFKKVSGENVVDSFKIFELNGCKIAFVGVTTPETITKSTPKYFMDSEGKPAYVIDGGEDGKALYAAVQKAIDDAKAAGADIVIGIGHLGIDETSTPWKSTDVIANVSGLFAFIDGHSHTEIIGREVLDKDGKTVILTQTGGYSESVGKMTIGKDLSVKTELITEYTGAGASETREMIDKLIADIDGKLGTVIGYAEEGLFAYNPADGTRLIRSQETNLGDFCADAIYYLFKETEGLPVDVSIMNAGGIRADIPAGEITYKTCKTVHTFGNVLCLVSVTGQQILDMLEWSYKAVGISEEGGFLHTTGLLYEIHTDVNANIITDENGMWKSSGTGEYRIQNVQVFNNETGKYEKLDLSKRYNIAGTNYTLRNMGDGFNMFIGCELIKDYVMEDYLCLANYVESFEEKDTAAGKLPTITKDQYSDINGAGRIVVNPDNTPETGESPVGRILLLTFIAGVFMTLATKKRNF